MRRVTAIALAGATLALVALAGCSTAGTPPAPPVVASMATWRWAPHDSLPAKPVGALPAGRRHAQPAAAPSDASASASDSTTTTTATTKSTQAVPLPPPPPDPKADATLVKAEVLSNGIALPPLESPPEVRAIVEAGNSIARTPYKWGGGHGRWLDAGYDCSGSVSYALAAGGLLNGPMASGALMGWGEPGPGKWVAIYANPGHVFLVVAGVRFDTVAAKQQHSASRWTRAMTSTSGYTARHPPGL